MIITNSQLRKVINEELQIVLLEQRLELFEHEAKRDVDKLLREVELQDPRAGFAKVVDFSLGLLNKALGLIKSAAKAGWAMVKAVGGGIKAAWRALRKFCSKHKKICILIGGLLACALAAAVYMVLKAKNICEDVGGACEEALGSEHMDAWIGYLDDWAYEEGTNSFIEGVRDGFIDAQANNNVEALREATEGTLRGCDRFMEEVIPAMAEEQPGMVELLANRGRQAIDSIQGQLTAAAGEAGRAAVAAPSIEDLVSTANAQAVASGALDSIGGVAHTWDLGALGEVEVDLTPIADTLKAVRANYATGGPAQSLEQNLTARDALMQILRRSMGDEAFNAARGSELTGATQVLRREILRLARQGRRIGA